MTSDEPDEYEPISTDDRPKGGREQTGYRCRPSWTRRTFVSPTTWPNGCSPAWRSWRRWDRSWPTRPTSGRMDGPRSASWPSGSRNNYPYPDPALRRARCSSRRTRSRAPPTRRRCGSTRTTTRSTAGRRPPRWRARRSPSSPRCSASTTHLGHLTASGTIANLEALWVARELHPGARDRSRAQRALHARAHVRACSAPRTRRSRRTPTGAWTSTRSTRGCAPAASAPWSRRSARPALGAVDAVGGDRRPVRRARRAPARRRRVRRLLHAARRRRLARRRRGPFDGLAARRLDRGRPAQARPAALRLRLRAVPRPGGRPPLRARLAVHLLHLGRRCTSARSAWSARAPAPPRPRCGRRCARCR